MSVSKNLKLAVAERNIEDIRGCLWACIAVDMNMTGKFKESFNYILENGISESELFEVDDDNDFKTEPTIENYRELGGLLSVNFSKKKLEALKAMGLVLYPPQQKEEAQKDIKKASKRRSACSQKKCDPFITGGAIVGAGCGAIAAAKFGARIGGIIGGGIVGATIGAIIGIAIANNIDKD